jgi:phosphatidylserine decarboxylase
MRIPFQKRRGSGKDYAKEAEGHELVMMPVSNKAHTRINNRLPVAREGLPFIMLSLALLLLFLYFGFLFYTILAACLSIFSIIFFRDPERRTTPEEKTVLIPADGRILDIRHLRDSHDPLGEPAVKISVFMSIFDVHVNRIPLSGKISHVTYHRGRFFLANVDKASEQNESNQITLETHSGHKIVFVQIAGFVARRIACWVKAGDEVQAGQRFGLIRFGSRVDVYLPVDSRIIAQLGHKVRAGKTILGYLP